MIQAVQMKQTVIIPIFKRDNEMSDSFKTKKSCKMKRLTGDYTDEDDYFSSPRYGNQRKGMAKDKIRERRLRRRIEKNMEENS